MFELIFFTVTVLFYAFTLYLLKAIVDVLKYILNDLYDLKRFVVEKDKQHLYYPPKNL